MRVKGVNRSIIWTFCLLSFAQLMAQGWEKTYGGINTDGAEDVIQLADGGYIVVGTTMSYSNMGKDILLIRTDPDGNQEWIQTFGVEVRNEFGKSVRQTTDGGYIIGGTTIPEGNEKGYLVKTDILGNFVWEAFSIQDSVQGRMAIPLQDGGFALVGSRPSLNNPPGGFDRDVFLMKVDENGNELWWNVFGGGEYEEGYGILELPNGDLVIAGITHSYGNGSYDAYLIRTDSNGQMLWDQAYGTENEDLAFALDLTHDGNFIVLTGQQNTLSNTEDDVYLLKIDLDGTAISSTTFEEDGLQTAHSIQSLSDGGYIIGGESRINVGADRNLFLQKIDAEGETEWLRTFGGTSGDGAHAVIPSLSGGFTAVGFTQSFGNGSTDAYMVMTDESGVSLSNFIAGNVGATDIDCGPDVTGDGVPNQIVQLVGEETYYGVTDEFGNFSIPVAEGTYDLSLVALSPYWEICQTLQPVTVEGVFDTSMVYLTIAPQTVCPLLQTDLSVNFLRPGFQSTYTVKYCNEGTIQSDNTLLDITFDDYMQVDSSSLPWVLQNGNTYTFYVGNVDIFECGDFQVFTTLDPTTTLGQTHCVESHIFPDSLCLPINEDWDYSSIELEAVCGGSNDSITFIIKNIGIGDMIGPQEFIVIEDQIVLFEGNYQLNSGAQTTVGVPANGSTYRLEADQSTGHPGNHQPSIAVEACGGDPFSTGFVLDFPQNDANPYLEIDCRENTGSYDPNDKQGFPNGYGEEHFIEPNTDIEYLIRFQNEGSDTAFQVVIRDTLSHYLNEFSLTPGASSHEYRFELYNQNVLEFTFDNIQLPHEEVDSLGSMGFVKFRIQQQVNNPIGSEIINSAAIYFDYNAPIITEPTYHRIGENFVIVDPSTSTHSPDNELTIKVFPNPFSEVTTFKLENVDNHNFTFKLFDLNGQLIQQKIFNGNSFDFYRNDLPSGMYLYHIGTNGKLLTSGKIVMK